MAHLTAELERWQQDRPAPNRIAGMEVPRYFHIDPKVRARGPLQLTDEDNQDVDGIFWDTGGLRPTLFERYQRTEKALLMTLQEMFIKGFSTREVNDVLEAMGRFEVSPGLVSRAAATNNCSHAKSFPAA